MTFNVNWGVPRPDLAVAAIRDGGADIVCLQETTPEWETILRQSLAHEYPHMTFRPGEHRLAGGLAFLSKVPMQEVAYVPSATTWFSGWIMAFETRAGPVQVVNAHLKPKVSERGSFGVSGYFGTGGDRTRELELLWSRRAPGIPTVVAGDFNDGDGSGVLRWLKERGLENALPEFDRRSPTWHWKLGWVTLRQRLDHIVYARAFTCHDARVLKQGASDHYPVVAVFAKRQE